MRTVITGQDGSAGQRDRNHSGAHEPAGMLPRFNTGGIVDSVDTVNNAMSEGVTDSSISSSGNIVDLNFNIGGNSYKAFADEDVANQLAEFLLRSEM